MSRAYRIKISENLRRHIEVSDGIQSKLEILDILPPEQTAALLERELAAAGFEQCEEDGQWVRVDADGVVVRVDAKQSTVTVSAGAEADVELTRERVVSAWAENDANTREAGRKGLMRELEGDVQEREKNLQAKVTRELEGKLGDLRRELDQISNRVTVDALKQKAASMGEVQEVSEDPQTGSLTIRVKL
jgi:hypothetical protein